MEEASVDLLHTEGAAEEDKGKEVYLVVDVVLKIGY